MCQTFFNTMNNGFSSGEEDSRGPTDQICCLIDDGSRCRNSAGNASYSKRIQKTVAQRRLKLTNDPQVKIRVPTYFVFLLKIKIAINKIISNLGPTYLYM